MFLQLGDTFVIYQRMVECDQCDSFLVVHPHAAKGVTDIFTRGQHTRLAMGAFRVNVNQPHFYRGQWIFKVPLAALVNRQ